MGENNDERRVVLRPTLKIFEKDKGQTEKMP